MRKLIVVPLVASLLLAPTALAKGPHAILTTGPDPIEAGRPWESTVELNEVAGRPRPSFIAFRRDGHVDGLIRRVPASMPGALGFKATMTFPAEGRWKLLLIAGRRRFSFPPVDVGSGRPAQDYVAFAAGSYAARHGAGGVYMEPENVEASGDGVRAPEVYEIAAARETGGDGGAATWWLLPVAGVVLAGAGVATLRGRR